MQWYRLWIGSELQSLQITKTHNNKLVIVYLSEFLTMTKITLRLYLSSEEKQYFSKLK